MKLNLFPFLFSLAVVHGESQPHHIRKLQDQSTDAITFVGDGCVNYNPNDTLVTWNSVPRGDDNSILVSFTDGFQFDSFGTSADSIYIATNGWVSRLSNARNAAFNRQSNDENISPFNVDNDTSGSSDGVVRYRQVGVDRFAVIWDEVYPYSTITANAGILDPTEVFGPGSGIHNTYEVVISAASSSHPQVCFCYEKLQWVDLYDIGREVGVKLYRSDQFLLANFVRDKDDHQSSAVNNGVYPAGTTMFDLSDTSICFELDDLTGDYPPTSLSDPRITYTSLSELNTGAGNDPHFKTWKQEHYQYHGQCDLILVKDDSFADELGLDIHIRTKLVRYWSYIKTAVIRIGNDILEVEGSSMDGVDKELHYWTNYEYQGTLTEFGGFPVTIKSDGTKLHKNSFEIDLSSKYPGQKIIIKTFKEFVKVDFVNPTEEAFGKTVGMLGDFKTGKTLARDGVTVLDDFAELGQEWQVIQSDRKLFRESSDPQFPALCIDPEDPRGDRRRRLEGSLISEVEAEGACAGLKD